MRPTLRIYLRIPLLLLSRSSGAILNYREIYGNPLPHVRLALSLSFSRSLFHSVIILSS